LEEAKTMKIFKKNNRIFRKVFSILLIGIEIILFLTCRIKNNSKPDPSSLEELREKK
jgi:hypothetical protein